MIQSNEQLPSKTMKKIFISSFLIMLAATACTSPAPVDEDPIGTHLDNQAFSEALGAVDSSKCDRIEDEDIEKECEEAVQDILLSNEALDNLDEALCSKISDERFETNCKLSIQDSISASKAQEEAQAKVDADLAIDIKAVETGSLSTCDTIADENLKQSCIYNVTVDKVAESGDLDLCEAFEDPIILERCKSSYQSEE